MAKYTPQDYLTSLKGVFPFIEESPALMNELSRRAGQGASPTQILADSRAYGEITSGARKAAEAQLNPSRDLALNALDLTGQDFNIQETDINREYDAIGRTLQEQADNARRGFEERQNELGLLRSGGTSAGLGKISSDLFRGQQESAQDKASRLASLALQRAGLGIQRAQVNTQYTRGIDDIVQQLLGQGQQRLSEVLTPDLSPVDLGDRIAFVDANGNVHQTLRKGKLPSAGSGEGNNTALLSLLGAISGQSAPEAQAPQPQRDYVGEFGAIVNEITQPQAQPSRPAVPGSDKITGPTGKLSQLFNPSLRKAVQGR